MRHRGPQRATDLGFSEVNLVRIHAESPDRSTEQVIEGPCRIRIELDGLRPERRDLSADGGDVRIEPDVSSPGSASDEAEQHFVLVTRNQMRGGVCNDQCIVSGRADEGLTFPAVVKHHLCDEVEVSFEDDAYGKSIPCSSEIGI